MLTKGVQITGMDGCNTDLLKMTGTTASAVHGTDMGAVKLMSWSLAMMGPLVGIKEREELAAQVAAGKTSLNISQ